MSQRGQSQHERATSVCLAVVDPLLERVQTTLFRLQCSKCTPCHQLFRWRRRRRRRGFSPLVRPYRPPAAGFLKVPTSIRKLWRVQKDRTYRNIFELEAIAPLLILERWGAEYMADCFWTHYIDNDGSLAALIRGSSSVYSGDCIVGLTWQLCSDLRIAPWFERVESSANPLDGLSRGRREGPWKSIVDFKVSRKLQDLLSQYGFE